MPRSVYEIVVTSRGTRTVQRDIRNIGRAASSTRRTLAFLRSALVVLASVQVLRGFVDLIDSFTLMQNRLKLVTNNMRETTNVMNALFKMSRETRTSFEGNVDLFARMSRATLDLNLNFRELLNATRMTALAIKVSGATAQEARAAVIQFGQGLAAGAAQGEELRSVVEQVPRLARIIGDEFGIAAGKLIDFNKANPGIITTERIMKALRDQAGQLEKEFDLLAPTITEGFTLIQNSLQFFLGGMTRATGLSEILASALFKIADNIELVVGAFVALGSIIVLNLLIAQVGALNGTILRLAGAGVGAVRTLLATFSFLLAPLTLLYTAFTLLGGAVVGALTPIAALAVGGGRALIALFTPVRTLVNIFKALRLVVLTNPLFFVGAILVGAVVGAFFLFRKEIDAVIERLGGLEEIFDDIVTGGIAAVQTIIQRWKELPAAIADLAIQAANFLVENLEKGVNGSISLLNMIPGIEIVPQDLGRFENSFTDAADRILRSFDRNFKAIKDGAEDLNSDLSSPNALGGGVFGAGQGQSPNAMGGRQAGGGVNFITNRVRTAFRDAMDFVNQFTAGGQTVDESLLGGMPPGLRQTSLNLEDDKSAKKAARELAQFRRELEQLVASVSPAIDLTLKLGEVTDIFAEAQRRGIDVAAEFGITQAEVLERVEREVLGVGNAVEEFSEKQDILRDAFKRNIISAKEYKDALRDLKLEMLEIETSAAAGLERGMLKIQKELEDTASLVENSLTNAFFGAEDAMVEFVATGKASFSDLVDSIMRDLSRLAIRQGVTAPLGGLLFGTGGSAGGLLGGLLNGGGGATIDSGGPFGSGLESSGGSGFLGSLFDFLPSFNNGGSFTVGPNSSIGRTEGIDNRLVAFRARDGERVNVSSGGGGGDRPINVNFNISTPDAESFRRSQDQIMARAQAALSRAGRRNN